MPHMIGSYVRARHPRYTQSLWLIRELETRVIPKRRQRPRSPQGDSAPGS